MQDISNNSEKWYQSIQHKIHPIMNKTVKYKNWRNKYNTCLKEYSIIKNIINN